MSKKIAAMIAAAFICVSAPAISSSAAELMEKDGKIYYVQEDGSCSTGWQKIDGKKYYFNKNGEAVTKNSVVGKYRYGFYSDGVCKGKYTGWTKADGKKFYYTDGIRQAGWYYLNDNWYYFDEKSGVMITETAEIDGIEQTFSSDGIWEGKREISYSAANSRVRKKLSADDYGGAYYENETLVVLTVNEENVRKVTEPLKKKYPQIVLKPCKFSKNELETVRAYLSDKMGDYEISGLGTLIMENCVGVTTEQVSPELQKYIDSLEDKSIIKIEIGKIIPV